jgi:hypothetical protein
VADKNKPEVYNRTFAEYVQLYNCPANCHTPNGSVPSGSKGRWEDVDNPVPVKGQGFFRPGLPPPPPKQGHLSASRGTNVYDALHLNSDGTLTHVVITDRPKQNFSQYATDWERDSSKLCDDSAGFIPVVSGDVANGEYIVVGHAGAVSGNTILAPAELLQKPCSNAADLQAVFASSPLFVRRRDSAKIPAGYSEASINDIELFVITSVDGEVMGFKYIGGPSMAVPFLEKMWDILDTLLDILMVIDVVTVLVDLAEMAGRKSLQSLERQTMRRAVMGGPTAEVADLYASKAAPDLSRGLRLKRGYDPRMGIPEEHLRPMIDAAKETKSIAVFRANKAEAIPLIRKGAVPKGKYFKFKSSKVTGVLTATVDADIATAYANNYYVVEAVDGKFVARRTVPRAGKTVTEELPLTNPYWNVEKGQVIAPNGNPVVGDYDLLGVLPLESPGRNIVAVPKNVEAGDWTGPDVQKYSDAVNKRLDQPRVLHGAQDGYGGLTDDTAYAVYPDGQVYVMEGKAAQEGFYNAYERQTAVGQYPRPTKPNPNPDISPAGRRR